MMKYLNKIFLNFEIAAIIAVSCISCSKSPDCANCKEQIMEIQKIPLDSSKFPIKGITEIRLISIEQSKDNIFAGGARAIAFVKNDVQVIFDAFYTNSLTQIFQQDIDNDGYDEIVLIINEGLGLETKIINIYRIFITEESDWDGEVLFEPLKGAAIFSRKTKYEFKDGKLFLYWLDYNNEIQDTTIYRIERRKIVYESGYWEFQRPERFLAKPLTEEESTGEVVGENPGVYFNAKDKFGNN